MTTDVPAQQLAIPAADVAKLLNISERHLWALNAREKMPRPLRLGRSVRWSLDEINAWLQAGAPDRERWEAMRS